MKHTEQTMWRALAKVVVDPDIVTRIEVTTGLGISDVEYVIGRWHGWIEFKADRSVKDSSKLQLGHEYTTHQFAWLNNHHNPVCNLRSWLIIGRHFGKEWIMLPAPSTGRILHKDTTAAQAKQLPGNKVYDNVSDVYTALRYSYS